MGRTFQVARIFGELTATENVIAAIEARKAAAGESDGPWWDWRPSPATRDEAAQILDDTGLPTAGSPEASLLSHGDKKRLELAVTLAGRPRLLMLDEPTAGMSVADRRSVADLLLRLKQRGVTLVMTEHDMDIIFDLADRLMVLNYGEVVGLGEPEAVRRDPVVQQVYLGKGTGHA
jgi:branched-chain amino acid transport system ATP-binding protein